METDEDLARVIIKILCRNNCVSYIGELNKCLKEAGYQFATSTNDLLGLIENFPGTFTIYPHPKTTDKIISVSTLVPLCQDHCRNNGQCNGWPTCTSLHVCKFFLLSNCRRKDCPFGHIIKTDHNYRVLARFLLDRLNDAEVKCVLRNVRNRTQMTKPDLCNSYNSARGCNRPNCAFLHVCKHFLENRCKSEETCRRSHDISTPGAVHSLRRFGIDMNRSVELILQDLRTMFESPDSPLTRYNSMTSLTSSNEPKPPVKNRSRSARRQRSGRERSPSPNPPQNPFTDYQLHNQNTAYPQPEEFGGARPKIRGQNPNLLAVPDGLPGQPSKRLPYIDRQGLLGVPGQSFRPFQRFAQQGQTQGHSQCPGQGQGQGQTEDWQPSDQLKSQDRPSRRQDRSLGQGQDRLLNQGQSQGQPIPKKQISKNKEKPDICLFHLSRYCIHRNNCSNVHKNMTYQWQYHDSRNWMDFDSNTNEDIEMNYCQPNEMNCFAKCSTGEVGRISFTEPMEMTTGSGETKMSVRRLSTVSSIDFPPGKFQWTTEWRWYWNLDGVWILYGEKDLYGAKSNMDSDIIEEKYLKDPKASADFKTSDFKYQLDFSAMTQTNLNTGTSRSVSRRPFFFKKGDLEKRTCPAPSQVGPVPEEWSIQKFYSSKSLHDHYEEVQLEETSDEFAHVADLFTKTMPRETLRRITRVECGKLWTKYSLKKKQMSTETGGMTVKELTLFHGTDRKFIEPICHQGFDFRFSGTRIGAKLGKGSYFARDAKYSSNYTDPNERNHAKMFVAKVLVGEYEVGDPSFVRPPPKNGLELYDSCVNNKSDPSIHVVFTLDQAYPQYLITYKVVKL